MPRDLLREISLPEATVELPDSLERLLRDADQIIRDAAESGQQIRIPALVSTNFRTVYGQLDFLRRRFSNPLFCEWGSGLGIVSMLAANLGFQAIGIEIEAELVSKATSLAHDHGLSAQFWHGSFVPPGGERWFDDLDDLHWMHTESDETYDQIGFEISDFDVIYVYPWPGETRYVKELFARRARSEAVLLCYQGADEWHAWSKA